MLDPPVVDTSKPSVSSTPVNKWLDRSFSLSDWTNEDSIDEDSLKKNNKQVRIHH